MAVKLIAPISLITVLLLGCGSSNDNNLDVNGTTGIDDLEDADPQSSTDSTESSGVMPDGTQVVTLGGSITVDTRGDRIFASALFFNLSEGMPFAFATFVPSEDVCEVTQFDPLANSDSVDRVVDSVSAGEVITFISPEGTYTELTARIESTPDGDILIYDSERELTLPAPSSLLVDIPGDVFPAFPAQAIQVVTKPQVTSPTVEDTVTPNTRFEWAAGTTANSGKRSFKPVIFSV